MNFKISSTEKRKDASLVRMMRPWLLLGTRGTVLILPSLSSNGERGAITRLGVLSRTHPVVLLELAD